MFYFFHHYLLDWLSLSALLIRPLFRSIFPNQYLISERISGLLLYVLWRIVKTHWPLSPFNLFTPKVMRYWVGLGHTVVQPILYHPQLVRFFQNLGPAIKHLVIFDIRASFFFICLLLSEQCELHIDWAVGWFLRKQEKLQIDILPCIPQDKWTQSYWPLCAKSTYFWPHVFSRAYVQITSCL